MNEEIKNGKYLALVNQYGEKKTRIIERRNEGGWGGYKWIGDSGYSTDVFTEKDVINYIELPNLNN